MKHKLNDELRNLTKIAENIKRKMAQVRTTIPRV